jgi:hypothetical protein
MAENRSAVSLVVASGRLGEFIVKVMALASGVYVRCELEGKGVLRRWEKPLSWTLEHARRWRCCIGAC